MTGMGGSLGKENPKPMGHGAVMANQAVALWDLGWAVGSDGVVIVRGTWT
jgi:hypothetical protein